MDEREEMEMLFQKHLFEKGMKFGMFQALSYMLDGKDAATFTRAEAQEYLDENMVSFDLYEENEEK